MDYIKILTIFAGIVTTIITFVFTTRAINYIAWKIREKIERKVSKHIGEYQHREYEDERRAELHERIDDLQRQVWELENKNKNKNKRSK